MLENIKKKFKKHLGFSDSDPEVNADVDIGADAER